MANEIVINYGITGLTLYTFLDGTGGMLYNGSTFENPLNAHWSTYAITTTEADVAGGGTGIYRASMPAVAAGGYGFVVYKQAGGSPAPTDQPVGTGFGSWDGSNFVDFADMSADVDATETRVTLALPSVAPNAAGGLLITAAGSLDMDDMAADIDNIETIVTAIQPSPPGAVPTAAQNATAVWEDLFGGGDFGTASSVGAFIKALSLYTAQVSTSYPLRRNTAYNGFRFYMVQAANPLLPATGLSVTGKVGIDTAAQVALTNAVQEVGGVGSGNGDYYVNLTAADLNAVREVTLHFTAVGAVPVVIKVPLQT